MVNTRRRRYEKSDGSPAGTPATITGRRRTVAVVKRVSQARAEVESKNVEITEVQKDDAEESSEGSQMDTASSTSEEETCSQATVSSRDCSQESEAESVSTTSKKKEADKENAPVAKPGKLKVPIRGRNKSNRFWKEPRGRSTSIIRGSAAHRGWEKQKRLRENLNRVKEVARALLQDKKDAKEAARQRMEENKKRKEENQRKAEIVQVIKNTSKIKRMKKKQLRTIQKRDTTEMVKK